MHDEKNPVQNPWWKAVVGLANALGGDLIEPRSTRLFRKAVLTVDVVRSLRADLDAVKYALGGGIPGEAKRLGLAPWGSVEQLDYLCMEYAQHAAATTLFTDPSGRRLVEVPLGHSSLYLCVSERDGRQWASNMYLREPERQAVARGIAALIWKEHATAALVVTSQSYWGNLYVDFAPIGDAGDYAVNNSGRESQLIEVATRTEKFRAASVSRRILLYGPPGTGKTTLARSLAGRVNGRLLQIPTKMVSQFGAVTLSQIIDVVLPDIVLFDDIDRNPEASTELLEVVVQAGAARGQTLVVVGTVNTLTTLDPALLRPGRFDETIEVVEPTPEYLRAIIIYYCDKFGMMDVDTAKATQDMAGFSPADVREVLQVVSVVGADVYDVEVARVRRQRELHSAGAVETWMNRGLPVKRGIAALAPCAAKEEM